jgi:hypothetical protein
MYQIKLSTEVSDSEIQQWKDEKRFLDGSYYDQLVRDDQDVEVLKPNGQTLFKIIRKAIPQGMCDVAHDVFEKAYQRKSAAYRTTAAGVEPDPEASSVTVGFLDRTARHGVKPCRQTSFTLKNPDLFRAAFQYISGSGLRFPEAHATTLVLPEICVVLCAAGSLDRRHDL